MFDYVSRLNFLEKPVEGWILLGMDIFKISDPEWYYRKFLSFFGKFLSENTKHRTILLHDIYRVYETTFGKKLSLLFPKTLNEKLIWLSLFWRHPDKVWCADKYKMRTYCAKKGLPADAFVPLLRIYSSADEIDFTTLPAQFVLKCNHGCGYNIIVKDKSQIDIEGVKRTLNGWLLEYYRGGVAETHYSEIKPRLIMCEKYLGTQNDSSIVDYKIHCINGRPVFILACYDRDDDEVAKLATFDFEWNQLFFCVDEQVIQLPKPQSLEKMLDYSKLISAEFPFLRADFYDVDGHPYLGEMTFTPYGNMIEYFKETVQLKYGRMLILPPKYVR